MSKLPGGPHLKAVRALEKVGFRIVRQNEHIVMPDGERILTIPRASGIVRDAGLSIERFRKIACMMSGAPLAGLGPKLFS